MPLKRHIRKHVKCLLGNDAVGLGTSRIIPASICSFTVRINYRNERKCRQSYAAGYGTSRCCGILCGGGYSTNHLGWKK